MKTLAQIYADHSACDKGSVHSYVEVYEQLLAPYRSATKVLEVGVFAGHSLRMWEEFFTSAEVHGIDLCSRPLDLADLGPMIAEGTHHISLLDAMLPNEVEDRFGGVMFDVIIEDASHSVLQQLAIYANFKPHLSNGGLYVIEDVSDLDRDRQVFERLDPSKDVRIIDRRAVKGRFDDVLVVISDK